MTKFQRFIKSKEMHLLSKIIALITSCLKTNPNHSWNFVYGNKPNNLSQLFRFIMFFCLKKEKFCSFSFHNFSYKMLISPNKEIDKALYVTKTYEPETLEFLRKNIKSTDVFLDIGSNSGIYSVICSHYVKKVYSFEPSSRELATLKQNIQINSIHNIEVQNIAIGGRNSKCYLKVALDHNSGHNTLANNFIYSGTQLHTTQEVTVKTLDSLFLNIPTDVWKIDVEGVELDVLKGARKIIQHNKPRIIIYEITEKFKQNKEISDWLESHNYNIFYILPNGDLTTKPIYKSGNVVAL